MKILAGLIATFICGFVLVVTIIPNDPTHWKVRNCELAEISPDFTPKQRADCRIMRSKAK